MLLNYLKLAFRLLLRNPFFTIINILGLSVGIAMFYFLWQYAQFELSSDQFHEDYQRIVRVGLISPRGDLGKQIGGTCHLEVSRRIKNDFDEIEDLTRILNQENFKWGGIPFHDIDIIMSTQSSDDERISFRETKVAYVEPNIFTFFTLPLLRGSAKNALAKPFSVVISERTAKKYFGYDDPMGRTLTINDSLQLVVTGILKNLPHNTHLDFEILISTTTIGNGIFSMGTKNMFAHCYFKLKEGVNSKGLEDNLNRSSGKYAVELEGQTSGPSAQTIFLLQPLDEVSFSFFRDDYFIPKSKITIIFFIIASLIILGMAWINYLNLTLAFNHRRMKEFAARKTLGAKSVDLIIQFITESLVVNTIAVAFAFTLIQLTRRILETEFAIYIPDLENDPYTSIGIIILLIVSGILFTGLYPALLTKAKTPKALLGSIHTPLQKNDIGMWLTTTQYTSAIILIIWAFVFMQQLNFMLNKNLGLDTDNVIAIDLPVETDYHSPSLAGFTRELSQNKDVLDFAVSRSVAGDDPVRDAWLKRNDSTYWGGGYTNGGVDERFLPFYKIRLLAGRNFLPDHPADEHHILVDMNALRVFGITNPQEAIGQDLWLQDQWPKDLWYPVKIIGVIETFSLRPLSQRIFVGSKDKESNVLTYKHRRIGDAPRKMSVRINPHNFRKVIGSLNQSFNASFPDKSFNWYFLDRYINRHYNADKYARNQIFLMTGLAIGIACLGLLGMMVNQVNIKTKELGIRKVLGAQLFQLGLVLLKSTIYEVALAVIIALPVAHFLVSKHLDYFMERITLHWSHYIIPVLILALLLLSTIGYTLIRALRKNPVESLRYE